MTKLVFSQEGYPRKVIIDKDTVCAISIPQVDSVNKAFIMNDKCKEEKDSLNSQINNYETLVEGQDRVIASQEKEIEIQKNISAEKDTIIASDEKLLKKQNRQVKWLKLQRNIFGAGAVLASGILAYQQITK